MEGKTFINRVDKETEWIVQKIELDAPVYDSYIKHIANMIPRKDVKINEHRIDVVITIFIPWPIFRHLCNACEDGEMKTADTKIVLTTQQS